MEIIKKLKEKLTLYLIFFWVISGAMKRRVIKMTKKKTKKDEKTDLAEDHLGF